MAILHYVTVEPVIFVYLFAIYMEMAAIQSIFFTKICLSIHHPNNRTLCVSASNLTDVELQTTAWIRYSNLFLNTFTFLGGLYAASWSDNFSRKIIMIIPLVGTAVSSLINMILSIYIDSELSYFFISATISGITFGIVGILTATFGFISDIVPEQSRTKRFLILEAMAFSGGTLGSYVCGIILKNTDFTKFFNNYAKVFALEAGLLLLILLYVAIRIPFVTNSQLEPSPISLTFKRVFSLEHVKNAFRTVFKKRFGDKRKKILLLLLCINFVYYGLSVQLVLSFIFVKHNPLNWDITKFSNYRSIQSGVQGVTLLLGLPIAFHIHIPDYIIAIIGTISRGAGLVLLGLSTTDITVYSTCAVFMFSEFNTPAIRSALSKLVEENERGQILAVCAILQNLSYFIGSLVFTSIYQYTLHIFPGLCFEVVAGLQGIALIILLYFYSTSRRVITSYTIMENEDGKVEESCSTKNQEELFNPVKS